MLDGGARAGAGAAIMTRDEDDIGFGLGDTCGNRADADLGDELNVDAGFGVGILEVVDELAMSSME